MLRDEESSGDYCGDRSVFSDLALSLTHQVHYIRPQIRRFSWIIISIDHVSVRFSKPTSSGAVGRGKVTIDSSHNESNLRRISRTGEVCVNLLLLGLVEGNEAIQDVIASSRVIGTA